MQFNEFFWKVFKNTGIIDAYLGYNESKKNDDLKDKDESI